MRTKSPRNKTIDFPLELADEYLKRCFTPETYDGRLNATVNGDAFAALKKVADESVDLLVVDPPYDLNKAFNGEKFKKMGYAGYAEYTQKWINAVKPKLKRTASVYVCSDWQSSV